MIGAQISANGEKAEFRRRMLWCVQREGSMYALAKRIGVVPNTVRGYLRGHEPKRPQLAAIARECGVNLEWLVTGASALAPDGYHAPTPTVQL